jgi:hypothetical protein
VIPMISASWIARITGVSHQCLAKAFLLMLVFVLGLPSAFWSQSLTRQRIQKARDIIVLTEVGFSAKPSSVSPHVSDVACQMPHRPTKCHRVGGRNVLSFPFCVHPF